ncbi:MAG: Uma2 family endonuclease [Acidobacteria bacterium]|nr:Uma2 family endonuclease [Acidobacteriota bacterium]
MGMQFVVNDWPLAGPARFVPAAPMTGDEFYDICAANPGLNMELTAQREIVIVPPASCESDNRSSEIAACIRNWVRASGQGQFFGSSAGFRLPSGAILSPDAAWVSPERMASIPKSQRKKYLEIAPSFVVEVMSPSDRLSSAFEKMQSWIAEGVDLGWLIDADAETIYIFRPGRPDPEKLVHATSISDENTLFGFSLDLAPIWAGL